MKILIIYGTTRKASTHKATQIFLDRLQSLGKYEVAEVWLHQTGLGMCAGCHNCILRGADKCKDKKVRDNIMGKIESSDTVIFVSPIHSMHISTIMKNFIDHLAYLWHRPQLFHKYSYVIMSGAGGYLLAKKIINYIQENAASWGMTPIGGFAVMNMGVELSQKGEEKRINTIRHNATKFHHKVQRGSHEPSLGQIFSFRMWQSVTRYSQKTLPLDHEYWTGHKWLDPSTNFYFPIKSWLRRIYSRLIGFFLNIFMRKNIK